jgi:hypothetical protein
MVQPHNRLPPVLLLHNRLLPALTHSRLLPVLSRSRLLLLVPESVLSYHVAGYKWLKNQV